MRHDRKSFWAILSIIFLDNIGLAIIYPIFTPLVLIPKYSLLPLHYSLSLRLILLGLLIASFPFTQFIGGFMMRHMVGRKGNKFVFKVTLFGEAIGFLCTGLALIFLSYPFLLIGRIISGFFAGNITICLSTIADFSSDIKFRSRNFKTVSSIIGISFVIAVAIGGALSNRTLDIFFNPAFPFWAITALSLLNIGIIHWYYKEPLHKKNTEFFFKKVFTIFKTSDLRFLYAIFFFFMLGWFTNLQFLSTFLIEYFKGGNFMITTTLFSLGLTWCIGSKVINKLLLRFIHPQTLLFHSLLLASICLFIAFSIPSFIVFYHLIIFGSLFASLTWSNTLSLITNYTSFNNSDIILELTHSVTIISMALAPFFGGLIGKVDIRNIYFFSSFSILLSIIIYSIFLYKKYKKLKTY